MKERVEIIIKRDWEAFALLCFDRRGGGNKEKW